jgi:ATP synthase F1 gamma subunit
MKRSLGIKADYEKIATLENVAAVFEAIASLHIAQVRDKVVSSTVFFNELWALYSMLRVGEGEYQRHTRPQISDRMALIAVTSESGLIGDIDARIIEALLAHVKRAKADIYLIGSHGASLLSLRHVTPKKVFSMPTTVGRGRAIHQMAQLFSQYEKASVYYQTYVSLARQEIARIELFSAVAALGRESKPGEEVISSLDYIFEPDVLEIISYLESAMLEIALGQVLLESRLAQYASRFNTMNNAKNKAQDMHKDLQMEYHRAKRGEGDTRIKEILGAMKAVRPSR